MNTHYNPGFNFSKGKPWSGWEDQLILKEAEIGGSFSTAAAQLGRTRHSVKGRAYRLGVMFHANGILHATNTRIGKNK